MTEGMSEECHGKRLQDLSWTVYAAAHGTNLDGAWIRANEARLLNKGAVFKFGASSREYKVQPLSQQPLLNVTQALWKSVGSIACAVCWKVC